MRFEKATLAGGCFWCTEAIFKRLRGVKNVVSGYSGGEMDNPTYDKVSSDTTGHAEAIQITFDPKVILFETLLEVFFKLHDPTTLNKQGADVGTMYRSVIFYHDDEQRKTAERLKEKIEESGMYKDPVVTEIVPFKNFYKAEEAHQNFYDKNRMYPLGPQLFDPGPIRSETHGRRPQSRRLARTASSAYCQVVIDPKISKLYKNFGKIVKKEAKFI